MNQSDTFLIEHPELKAATPEVWMAIGRFQSSVGELTLKDSEVVAQRDSVGHISHEFLESLKRSQRYRKWCRSRLIDFGLSEELVGEIARAAKAQALAMRAERLARISSVVSD